MFGNRSMMNLWFVRDVQQEHDPQHDFFHFVVNRATTMSREQDTYG